jgi:hypothetical protein
LIGQGNVIGAAWALAEAVRADATDNRAAAILEKLSSLHPILAIQCPWITQALAADFKTNPDILLM